MNGEEQNLEQNINPYNYEKKIYKSIKEHFQLEKPVMITYLYNSKWLTLVKIIYLGIKIFSNFCSWDDASLSIFSILLNIFAVLYLKKIIQ